MVRTVVLLSLLILLVTTAINTGVANVVHLLLLLLAVYRYARMTGSGITY
jgi:hypothetical protein